MNLRIYTYILLILLTFACLGCADPKQVPVHIRNLQSDNSSVRNKAALELGRIGSPHAAPAVPHLIRLLDDDNPGVQSSVAYALRKIDTPQARVALDKARRFKR